MRTLSLTLDALDRRHRGAPAWAWQGNALTLAATLSGDVTLHVDTATIVAQIHSTGAPGGETPLAATDVAVGDGESWELSFTASEMSFTIGDGETSAVCYLFITAMDAASEPCQALYAGRIEIKAATHSAIDPVPTGAVAISVTSGVATFSTGTSTYTFPVSEGVAAAEEGDGTITVTDGIASFTIDSLTYTFPVGTA